MKKILFIEDSPDQVLLVSHALKGFQVDVRNTLADAQSALNQGRYDLIILDLGLPDGDGLVFLSEMLKKQIELPSIFVVTAEADIAKKVLAFSLGADDYITKPVNVVELRARVEARLKKIENIEAKKDVFSLGRVEMIVSEHKVFEKINDQKVGVDLTPLEFRLLQVFMQNPERVFSRSYLLSRVWGENRHVTERTIDTHIGHVRKKLKEPGFVLEAVLGEGYRLRIQTPSQATRL